jgi:hypothetical protein
MQAVLKIDLKQAIEIWDLICKKDVDLDFPVTGHTTFSAALRVCFHLYFIRVRASPEQINYDEDAGIPDRSRAVEALKKMKSIKAGHAPVDGDPFEYIRQLMDGFSRENGAEEIDEAEHMLRAVHQVYRDLKMAWNYQ